MQSSMSWKQTDIAVGLYTSPRGPTPTPEPYPSHTRVPEPSAEPKKQDAADNEEEKKEKQTLTDAQTRALEKTIDNIELIIKQLTHERAMLMAIVYGKPER